MIAVNGNYYGGKERALGDGSDETVCQCRAKPANRRQRGVRQTGEPLFHRIEDRGVQQKFRVGEDKMEGAGAQTARLLPPTYPQLEDYKVWEDTPPGEYE